MGGFSLGVPVRRVGEGDRLELHHAIRDAVTKSVSAKMGPFMGISLRNYFASDEYFSHSSERALRSQSDDEIALSFVETDSKITPLVAYHGCERVLLAEAKRLDKIARGLGFAIVSPVDGRDIDELLSWGDQRLYFAVPKLYGCFHVERWQKGSSLDVAPEGTDYVTNRFAQMPIELRNTITACAMTGWCRCGVCAALRKSRKIEAPLLDDSVLRAWALLERDELGAKLARMASDEAIASKHRGDGEACSVFADWLAENNAPVSRVLIPGLARTYCG